MDAELTVAEYITHALKRCGKTQLEVAKEAGYRSPNMITHIKNGQTKISIAKVELLAKALDIEPIKLLRLVLKEYDPETLRIVERNLGRNAFYAEADEKLLHTLQTFPGLDAFDLNDPWIDHQFRELLFKIVLRTKSAGGPQQ